MSLRTRFTRGSAWRAYGIACSQSARIQMTSWILDGDAEWIAIDRSGFVGFFTTCGHAAVPECYVEEPECYLNVIKWLRSRKDVGSHTLAVPRESGRRYWSWTEPADKGLYAFDIDVMTAENYVVIAKPTRPLQMTKSDIGGLRPPCFDGVFASADLLPSASVREWKRATLKE